MDFGFLYKVMIPVGFLVYFYILFIKTPEYNNPMGLGTKLARRSAKSWRVVQRVAGALCGANCVLTLAVNFALPYFMGEDNAVAYWIGIALEIICLSVLVPLTNVIAKKLLKK